MHRNKKIMKQSSLLHLLSTKLLNYLDYDYYMHKFPNPPRMHLFRKAILRNRKAVLVFEHKEVDIPLRSELCFKKKEGGKQCISFSDINLR